MVHVSLVGGLKDPLPENIFLTVDLYDLLYISQYKNKKESWLFNDMISLFILRPSIFRM